MIYDYACSRCGPKGTRHVLLAERDNQVCDCGGVLNRLPHFTSVTIGIPAGFQTTMSDVIGTPGSQEREQFEKDIRSGEIVPVGKGSRWV